MSMAIKGRLGLHPLKPAKAELRNFSYYSYPIYRHPADELPSLRPFSPTISQIRAHVKRALQQSRAHST